MEFDLDEGLFIFEVTLGYKVGESDHMTVPFILRADDTHDAEELVEEYLEVMHLASRFWITDISGPFDPDKYQTSVDEGERERWDRLEDHSEEDLIEILHSEEI